MTMKVGSKNKFSEVNARDWVEFALQAGLTPAEDRKRIMQLARQLLLAARRQKVSPDQIFAVQ